RRRLPAPQLGRGDGPEPRRVRCHSTTAGPPTTTRRACLMATAYMVPRYRVTLVQETGPEIAPQLPVHNPDVAYWVLRPYFDGLDREHFVSLLLDIKHRLIGLNVISIGHLSAAPVHPREVYKAAVTANAAAIIVAHNHPSG